MAAEPAGKFPTNGLISIELLSGRASPFSQLEAAQPIIKLYSGYILVSSAPASPIWKSPIPPNPSLCALFHTRQIFRPAKRGRQPTCALRWIALLTFASPKKHNKVNWGSGGLKHTSHCLELARRRRRRQQGLYPSLGHLGTWAPFHCISGTTILHRSIPILSIVRVAQNLDTRIIQYRQAACPSRADLYSHPPSITSQPALGRLRAHPRLGSAAPLSPRLIVRPERKYFTVLDLSTKTIFRAFRDSQID